VANGAGSDITGDLDLLFKEVYAVGSGWPEETFAECSILFKFKEGENFNHRNILDISRIKS